MERKIGEIFEFGNEWYQCVESDSCGECSLFTTECGSGTKSNLADKVFGQCSKVIRTDNKHVVFKKLEKVGEPVVKEGGIFQCLNSRYISCIGCVFRGTTKHCDKDHYLDGPCPNNEIWVEKKQNKENELKQNGKNMEENKTNCGQCGDKRLEVIAKAKADLLKSTNIENDEKEMAVIDNILFRCAQMGWLEKYEEEEEKLNLKPFELQKAKAGKPVCTRDGRKARIVCFDKKNDYYPIIALVEYDEKECIFQYTSEGEYIDGNESTSYRNLMMLPEKKEGWVNIYRDIDNNTPYTENDNIYSSRDKAKESAKMLNMKTYIDTIKVYWEE